MFVLEITDSVMRAPWAWLRTGAQIDVYSTVVGYSCPFIIKIISDRPEELNVAVNVTSNTNKTRTTNRRKRRWYRGKQAPRNAEYPQMEWAAFNKNRKYAFDLFKRFSWVTMLNFIEFIANTFRILISKTEFEQGPYNGSLVLRVKSVGRIVFICLYAIPSLNMHHFSVVE